MKQLGNVADTHTHTHTHTYIHTQTKPHLRTLFCLKDNIGIIHYTKQG